MEATRWGTAEELGTSRTHSPDGGRNGTGPSELQTLMATLVTVGGLLRAACDLHPVFQGTALPRPPAATS